MNKTLPPDTGTKQNGTRQNGTKQNGTRQNGTRQNGTRQNGTRQNGTKQNDILTRTRRFLAHPKVAITTDVCDGLLKVCSSVAQAKYNPVAAFMAVGSAVDVLSHSLSRKSLVDIWLEDNDMVPANEFLPKLLHASGLLHEDDFSEIMVDRLAEERLVGCNLGGHMVVLRQRLRGSDQWLDGDLFEGLATDATSVLARTIIWTHAPAGVEIAPTGRGYRESSILLPLPSDPAPAQIGKDVLAFANTTDAMLKAGHGRSVILHGPPGTGKSTFAHSYAELVGHRLLKIGEAAFDQLEYGELKRIVEGLEPTALLLDDIGKCSALATFHALLPILRRQRPDLVIVVTCNDLKKLGSSFLRPGRGGELIYFGPPDKDERAKVLRHYLDEADCSLPKAFTETLGDALPNAITHDWCRDMASQIALCTSERDALTIVEKTISRFALAESTGLRER